MKTYLVGGAVRDELLGYPFHERDWVVVGATAEQMLEKGYQQVGKDFPVFLHPKSHEEYALARTERKSGKGYTGFICHSAPDVTLEEDLLRRDLTINAIAKDENGELVDPYNGQQDIENRVLRHVSAAFAEDPLRILRVARFAARYYHLGFRIADETLALMQQMVDVGEAGHLVPERVWKEIHSALTTQTPAEFFRVIRACGALKVLIPELDALFGVPQPKAHHPEIDTGEHIMLALQMAAQLSASTTVRYATLMHDLGKALTPADQWPKHYGHDVLGVKPVNVVGERLKVPKQFTELARLSAALHIRCHICQEMRPVKLLELIEAADAMRRPDRFEELLLVCEADIRGRKGFEEAAYPQARYLKQAFEAYKSVNPKQLVEQGFKGKVLGEELRKQRIDKIAEQLGR
ncbi:tRNA nucleotidyltransferase [gamma proteobacterium IMCC2047]|nr:tRNA nucleotidyltransferase [gamma proteobacterium IMCC2047]